MKQKTGWIWQIRGSSLNTVKASVSRLQRSHIILGIMLGATLLVGCGGGGGDVGAASSSSTPLAGAFVDSPVEGLEYETGAQSGITDANGTFKYMAGESITFHVGDLMLGKAMAKAKMTPVDLVAGAMDETHPMVTNMARFLQTMDADMDPENGITITEEMADAMLGHKIDFDMDMDKFEYDPDVQDAMNAMNMMDSSRRMMVSIEGAREHLGNTMKGMMTGGFRMGSNGITGDGMTGGGMMGNGSEAETDGTGIPPGNQMDMPGNGVEMMPSGSGMMN